MKRLPLALLAAAFLGSAGPSPTAAQDQSMADMKKAPTGTAGDAAAAPKADLTAQRDAIKAKAAAIEKLAKEFTDSITAPKGTMDYYSKLPSQRQAAVLGALIRKTGRPLPDPKDPNAKLTNVVQGGTTFDEFYALMDKLAKTPEVTAAVNPPWKAFLDKTASNEDDGTPFNREQMRVIFTGDKDAYAENAKLGALNKIDPATGKDVRDSFYRVRSALNDVNEWVKATYKQFDSKAMAAIQAKADVERKATEKALAAKKAKIAGITAENLFDGSKASAEDKQSLTAAIAGNTQIQGKNVVFTTTDQSGKKQTVTIPQSDFAKPAGLAQNPKFQQLADALRQDTKISVIASALQMAVKAPKEVAGPAKQDPVDGAAPAPVSPDLTVKPAPSALSPDQQALLAKAQAAGPGCTKNSMENLKDNMDEQAADAALKKLKASNDAGPDFKRKEAAFREERDNAVSAAQKEYDAATKSCNADKNNGIIDAAGYQACISEPSAKLAAAKSAAAKTYKEKFAKAQEEALSAVTASKATTDADIARAKGENAARVNGLYTAAIKAETPKVRDFYSSPEGYAQLKKFSPNLTDSAASKKIVSDYLEARWAGTSPAAADDARKFIVEDNGKYLIGKLEPFLVKDDKRQGVAIFVEEKDFKDFLAKRIEANRTSAPKNEVKPETPAQDTGTDVDSVLKQIKQKQGGLK